MSDHDGVEQVITMAWRAHLPPSTAQMRPSSASILGRLAEDGKGK
jgi:hypothetical protein